MTKRFPRAVWLLGWVSFFTDLASEAIYPLLPGFLTRVLRAGALELGYIEGAAEAASSLLKIGAGRASDRWRVRKPIVLAGYSLSSAVRPLIALVTAWPQVFVLRFVDRVGKGVRGAPRDAMLAALAPADMRGRVFGFNRAMDHAGAVAGPLLASLFLFFYPESMRALFALTLLPGIIVVAFIALVPEVKEDTSASTAGAAFSAAARRLPADLYRLLAIILLFTLGNSTDAFLLLRLGDLGVPTAAIPLLWAVLHVIKSVGSAVGGSLSDRIGRRTLIASGWVVYAVVYAGFALESSAAAVITLFLVYGIYYGLSESPEKALVADLTPADLRGTAFGFYNGMLGFGGLLASVVFGALWTAFGAPVAFALGAALALSAALALAAFVREPRRA